MSAIIQVPAYGLAQLLLAWAIQFLSRLAIILGGIVPHSWVTWLHNYVYGNTWRPGLTFEDIQKLRSTTSSGGRDRTIFL